MNGFLPLVAIISFFLPFSEALPSSASNFWTLLVFALLAACAVLGKIRRTAGGLIWLAAAYLALAGVVGASGHADLIGDHFKTGFQIIVFLALGPYALRYLMSVRLLRAAAIIAFLVGQTISSATAMAQAGGLTVIGFNLLNGRAPGLAGHPNILGVLSSVVIVLAIHLIFYAGKLKPLLFFVLVVNIGALVTSGSISALIACGIGFVVYMLSARVSFRIPVLVAGGAAAILWILGQVDKSGLMRGTYERVQQVTGQTGDVSTLDIRQSTYAFAWDWIAKDPIFGRGLDDSSGATFDSFTLTHNVLLRSWFQGGVAMAMAFALIYGVLVVIIIRAVIRGIYPAPTGVLAIVVCFSMTSAALQQGYFWLLILGALAFIEPGQRFAGSGTFSAGSLYEERRAVGL